jgi:hypothetical protein
MYLYIVHVHYSMKYKIGDRFEVHSDELYAVKRGDRCIVTSVMDDGEQAEVLFDDGVTTTIPDHILCDFYIHIPRPSIVIL